MAEAFNKIGFHTGPAGNPTGIGDWERQLDAAGIPFFLKSVDSYGQLHEAAAIARASGVAHTLVYRLSTYGQGDGFDYDVPAYHLTPAEAADRHWQHTLAKLPPEFDKSLVWVEPINEVDKDHADWLGHFAAELGALALRDGYKVTLFGWSSGEPEPEHWQTAGMRRYLELCGRFPNRLAVSLHEYSYTLSDIRHEFPFKVGRFQFLFDACDAMGIARPTVHITEWGWTHEEVPEPAVALQDIEDIAALYAQHPEIKGAAVWYLGVAFGGIAHLAQKLIAPVTELTLTTQFEVIMPNPNPNPAPPPAAGYTVIVNLLPQNVTAAEVAHVLNVTFPQRESVVYSADDAVRLMVGAKDGSKVKPWSPGRWTDSITDWLAAKGVALIELHYLPGDEPAPPPPAAFKATAWPATAKRITQPFGVNPQNYAQFGLPGHEGIDLESPIGSPYFAIAAGVVTKVSDKRSDGTPSNYGWHVIVDHENGYTSLYAHAQPNPPAVVGKRVAAGDILALSGNTGNSSGPHLHLTIKKAGYTAPGWGCCPGYIDPWPFLEGVYNQVDPPRPPLVNGYGYTNYLAPAGGYLIATANVNIRTGPGQSNPLVGTLRLGSMARPLGAAQNGYRPVEVSEYDLYNYNPNPQPPPAGNVEMGLHTGAGGYSPPEELAEFADLKPQVIKTMSHHDPAAVGALAAAHPAASWIVRVYLTMHGRDVSPEQFFNDTIGDVRRTLNLLGGRKVVIEPHNEPNLRTEGLDSSWANGAAFNTWYLDLLARYRAALPGRSFIFPGLSPGHAFDDGHERRQEHVSFWQQCRPAIEASDGLGIHLYWSKDYPMAQTLGQLDACRSLFPAIPLYVTEASNNKGGRTPQQKAAEYVQFRNELQNRRDVRAVTYFIASPGDHPDWWGWQGDASCEAWAGQGIGRLVRTLL